MTTSSFRHNFWNTGSRRLKCYNALHFTTRQANQYRRQLVDKIKRSATFNQGFATVEYLSAALIDMKLHLAGDRKIDADAFERETSTQLGMPKEIVMRHRTPQFLHVFSSDAYSAGYYSYLWSDVLTADAFGAFVEGKGAVRSRSRGAPAQVRLLSRQHHRSGRRLSRLPRTRSKDRRA